MKKNRTLLLGLFFSLIFSQLMTAQSPTPFFEASVISYQSLNSAQQDQYQRNTTGGIPFSNTQFVQVNDIAAIQQDGEITVKLPGKVKTARVAARDVTLLEDGYYWHGTVVIDTLTADTATQYVDGYVSLFKQSNRYTGSLTLDDEVYHLSFIGEGVQIVSEVDTSLMQPYSCFEHGPISEEVWNLMDDDTSGSVYRNDYSCPVKVLALYTQRAASNCGSPETLQDRIQLAIWETNSVLKNSQIAPNDISLQLVDIQPFDFMEEVNGLMQNEMENRLFPLLENSTSGLTLLRDSYDADIVVLFTNGNYPDHRGLGNDLKLSMDPDHALVVIEIQYTNSELLVPHEFGHVFVAGHQGPNTGPDFNKAYSYKTNNGFGIFGKRRRLTAVNTNWTINRKIPYYSNPDVFYFGEATGVEFQDNARIISATGCTVASYRTINIDTLSGFIKSPFSVCIAESVPVEAVITGRYTG